MGALGAAAATVDVVEAVSGMRIAVEVTAMAVMGCMAGDMPGGSICGEVPWACCSCTGCPVGLNMTCWEMNKIFTQWIVLDFESSYTHLG